MYKGLKEYVKFLEEKGELRRIGGFVDPVLEIACASVNRPALTKLTVMTVVAVDDCTDAVTKAPVSIPVNRFFVIA